MPNDLPRCPEYSIQLHINSMRYNRRSKDHQNYYTCCIYWHFK